MLNTLTNFIVEKLKANNLIQEVYDYEAGEFKGDPAVSVTPSSNESDYRTTSENERIYAFTARIFVARKERDETGKEADRILRTLVDSVMNDFDSDYLFTSMSDIPTGHTMLNVFAIPSQWGYAGREDEYRVAEVGIRCRVYVDINSI